VYLCVRVCICTHTQTARGVLRCELRGRHETLGELEESRWTKSQDTFFCIHICVRSTHVYMYAGRRDQILEIYFFQHIFPSEKKSKRCKCRYGDTENSNPRGYELHRPSIKGIKLLFKVIKVIMIIIQ